MLHQDQGIRADTVRALQLTEGIELVTPSWMTSMLTIVYDPTRLYLDDIRKIIKEANNLREESKKPYYRGFLS